MPEAASDDPNKGSISSFLNIYYTVVYPVKFPQKKKLVLGLILTVSLLINVYAWSALAEGKSPKEVEIVRDEFEIPKITAPTKAMLFNLCGYTVPERRLWQFEFNRRDARGTIAEFGP